MRPINRTCVQNRCLSNTHFLISFNEISLKTEILDHLAQGRISEAFQIAKDHFKVWIFASLILLLHFPKKNSHFSVPFNLANYE